MITFFLSGILDIQRYYASVIIKNVHRMNAYLVLHTAKSRRQQNLMAVRRLSLLSLCHVYLKCVTAAIELSDTSALKNVPLITEI